MKVNMTNLILKEIGDTSFYGDEYFDRQSLENMETLETVLDWLISFEGILVEKLEEHKDNNKNYASGKKLYDRAKDIMKRVKGIEWE